MHREADPDFVAGFPFPVDAHITGHTLRCREGDGLAVDCHTELFSGPGRMTDGKGVFAAFGDGEVSGDGVRRGYVGGDGIDAGEQGLLTDTE